MTSRVPCIPAGLSVLVLLAATVCSAEEPKVDDEIVIYGTTPLSIFDDPVERMQADVQTFDADDLQSLGVAAVSDALSRRAGGVHVGQTTNNPFQADVTYRGFVATSVLGAAQGLSVFQDGVRVNEFLADTVNWDLVPEDAIASLMVVPGADPVYGRNTLGGAIALQTKRGFTHPGIGLETSYGSFDRREFELEAGGSRGDFDGYLFAGYLEENGFRDESESRVGQYVGQVGWRDSATDVKVVYSGARNELFGNAFAPENLLAEDRSAVYTHPDIFEPELDAVTVNARHRFGTSWRADAAVYFRNLYVRQFSADEAGDDDEEDDGGEAEEVLAGVNRLTRIAQRRFGVTAQASHESLPFGGENHATAGVDFDRGQGDLRLSQQPGFIDERRTVIGTGAFEPETDVETSGEAVGLFATDTWTPRDWLSLTISARWDRVHLDIDDQLEGDASGDHTFHRVNPAIGAIARPWRRVHFFARYAESFRAPTAIELTCASEADPCPLPIAIAEDPPLDRVRARAAEAGLRAKLPGDVATTLSFFRTDLDDDILFVAATRGAGFFRNVDETRRQGVGVRFGGDVRKVSWFLDYSYTRATFETTVALPSPLGDNVARPGDELPGVPNHLLKTGFDAPLPIGFAFGVDLAYTGGQYLRGDEANRFSRLGDYVVVNAGLEWSRGPVSIFARAENLFDAEYETFGSFGENVFNEGRVERFLSPGAPIGGWFGVEVDI